MKSIIAGLMFLLLAVQPLRADVYLVLERTFAADWREDLNYTTPQQFLNILTLPVSKMHGNVWVKDKKAQWMTAEDVVKLIPLLDSEEPCASVVLSASSYLSLKPSTVSHEVAYMIVGYFRGHYPPELHSQRPDFGGKKEALRLLAEALKKGAIK